MDVDMDFASQIRENFDILLRSIDPSPPFVSKLCFSHVISREESEKIKLQASTDSKIDTILSRLIEICSTDRRDAVIKAFLTTLRSCDQEHVANIFEKTSDAVPMSDEHFEALTSSLSEIEERLDPDCGIVDRLFSGRVITFSERGRILSATTCSSKISAIIETLLRKSDGAFVKFIETLRETGQDHVAYLLNQKCGIPASDVPVSGRVVPMSDEHCRMLRRKLVNITEILDPECGIVEELYSRSVFTLVDVERIGACGAYTAKANAIIAMLLRKPDCAFDQFLDALKVHGQQHVVFTITGDGPIVPVREEFVLNMAKQRAEIVESMVLKHGLLDRLVGLSVLNIGKYGWIDVPYHNPQQMSDSDMNVELLRLIPRRSQDAFGSFILALYATGQKHVAQLFVGEEVEGKLNITFSDKEVDDSTKKLAEQRLKITLGELLADEKNEKTEFENDLTRALTANDINVSYVKDGCIAIGFRCRTAEALKSLKDLYDRRELDRLFTVTYKSLFTDVGNIAITVNISDDSFRRCAEEFANNAPMSAVHRKSLLKAAKSRQVLKKLLVTDDLLNELSFSERQMQAIRGMSGTRQAQTLLEMIARQPDSDFDKFTKVLETDGQLEMIRFLCESTSESMWTETNANGLELLEVQGEAAMATSHQPQQILSAVEQVPESSQWRSTQLHGVEEDLEEKLEQISDVCFQPPTERSKLMEMDEMAPREQLELVTKRETQCRLCTEFERKIHKDQLEELMERERLSKNNEELLAVETNKLKQECADTVNVTQTLPHKAEGGAAEIKEKCESPQQFGQPIMELMELVLLRSFIRSFSDQFKSHYRTHRAIRQAYETLAAVCHTWRQTLRGWEQSPTKHWMKHKIRRCIQRHCSRPYNILPTRLITITIVPRVRGVLLRDNKLFVVRSESNTMFVFDAENDFKPVDNISLGDMNGPTDMVCCAESGHIYIAGKSGTEDLVIRLSPDGKQVEPWLPNKSTTTLTPFSVWSLSMTSGRLLVTSKEHFELRLHEPDGTEDKVIKLSNSKGLWHAVETPRGTFVVAHASPQSQVTEIDSKGDEIGAYKGSVRLGDPYHLVVDSDGRIIVADWKKDRILLLNDRLGLERVLLDDVSNPMRLCLVEKTGQLFIGSWMSNCVELYQIGLKTC